MGESLPHYDQARRASVVLAAIRNLLLSGECLSQCHTKMDKEILGPGKDRFCGTCCCY